MAPFMGYSLKKTWLLLFVVICVCLLISFHLLYLRDTSLLGHYLHLSRGRGIVHYDDKITVETTVEITQSHSIYGNDSINEFSSLPSIKPTTSVPSPSNNDTVYRYVIQWFNWEQLTMAANNMISLAWFVTSWKAHLIEPFSCNSRYFGLPHPRQKTYSLFDLLNYEKFNRLLSQHNISYIVHFNDFIEHANRNVIVIHLLYDGFDLTRFGNRKQVSRNEIISLLHKKGSDHYSDCSRTGYMKRIGRTLLQWINNNPNLPSSSSSSLHPFRITHYCCVNGSYPTLSKEMATKCNIPSRGNVTVIFTDWKGLSPIKNFRVFVPEAKNVDMPHPSRDVYPYSFDVLNNASRFLSSLINGGQEFVGVHLRTEKMGPRNGKEKEYFDRCLIKSNSIKEHILSNYTNSSLPILYFSDIGPFGTKSCMRNCLTKQYILSSFNKYGIKLSQYDPVRFGGIVDSGFVAAIEQETLSRAKVLVLVGGGSFQSQVKTRYKYYRYRRKHFVYHVCIN